MSACSPLCVLQMDHNAGDFGPGHLAASEVVECTDGCPECCEPLARLGQYDGAAPVPVPVAGCRVTESGRVQLLNVRTREREPGTLYCLLEPDDV